MRIAELLAGEEDLLPWGLIGWSLCQIPVGRIHGRPADPQRTIHPDSEQA